LLNWMENLHASTNTSSSSSSSSQFASLLPQPNYQSYALAIDAWAQAAVIESSKEVLQPLLPTTLLPTAKPSQTQPKQASTAPNAPKNY